MRPVGLHSIPPECVAVAVLRPRLGPLLFVTIMLVSLFLTFHVLYDSAVYSMQVLRFQPVSIRSAYSRLRFPVDCFDISGGSQQPRVGPKRQSCGSIVRAIGVD